METIEISDKLYKEILAHRQGRESISKVIERNFKPEKSTALQELEGIGKGKFYTRTQIEKDIEKLDADIARSEKTKTYSSEQMKKRLGL